MRIYKFTFRVLFLSAVVYLMMCPDVLVHSKNHDHHLLIEQCLIKKMNRKINNGLQSLLPGISKEILGDIHTPSGFENKLPVISILKPTIGLSIVKTSRLII